MRNFKLNEENKMKIQEVKFGLTGVVEFLNGYGGTLNYLIEKTSFALKDMENSWWVVGDIEDGDLVMLHDLYKFEARTATIIGGVLFVEKVKLLRDNTNGKWYITEEEIEEKLS